MISTRRKLRGRFVSPWNLIFSFKLSLTKSLNPFFFIDLAFFWWRGNAAVTRKDVHVGPIVAGDILEQQDVIYGIQLAFAGLMGKLMNDGLSRCYAHLLVGDVDRRGIFQRLEQGLSKVV